MSFFDNLNDQSKKDFLFQAQESLTLELAQILIRSGVDPDTFDYANFDPDNFQSIADAVMRIGQISGGLAIIDAKLAELD
jgi:hypothetical protein